MLLQESLERWSKELLEGGGELKNHVSSSMERYLRLARSELLLEGLEFCEAVTRQAAAGERPTMAASQTPGKGELSALHPALSHS